MLKISVPAVHFFLVPTLGTDNFYGFVHSCASGGAIQRLLVSALSGIGSRHCAVRQNDTKSNVRVSAAEPTNSWWCGDVGYVDGANMGITRKNDDEIVTMALDGMKKIYTAADSSGDFPRFRFVAFEAKV